MLSKDKALQIACQVATDQGWPEQGRVEIVHRRRYLFFGQAYWQANFLFMRRKLWGIVEIDSKTGDILSARMEPYYKKPRPDPPAAKP